MSSNVVLKTNISSFSSFSIFLMILCSQNLKNVDLSIVEAASGAAVTLETVWVRDGFAINIEETF